MKQVVHEKFAQKMDQIDLATWASISISYEGFVFMMDMEGMIIHAMIDEKVKRLYGSGFHKKAKNLSVNLGCQ